MTDTANATQSIVEERLMPHPPERVWRALTQSALIAEWLMQNRYTKPARLAIDGVSNGGLLMGAMMTHRPDLFGAIVCRAPLLDMLRYHKMLVGSWWAAEYGSADDPITTSRRERRTPRSSSSPAIRTRVSIPPTRAK